MPAIPPAAFASRLGDLSGPAFASFVADLWAAADCETAVDGPVVAVHRGGTERRLLVVAPARLPRLRTAPDPGGPVDAVVTSRRRERSLPRGTPAAPVITADDLRNRLLYGVDPDVAERLCRQTLGVVPRGERWEPDEQAFGLFDSDDDGDAPDQRLTRRTALGALGAAGVSAGGVVLGRQLLIDGTDGPDETSGDPTDDDGSIFEDSGGEDGGQGSDDQPEASFEFELENAEIESVSGREIVVSTTGREWLVITHTGGDPIPAGELVVRGRGLGGRAEYQWSDDEQYGVETEVTRGDSIRLPVNPSYEITVLYASEDGEEQALVHTTGPTVMDGDSRPQRPDASFEVGKSDGGLVVYHESGDPIRAEYLFLRGSGFEGAPLVQWLAGDDDGDSPLVVPGNSLRLDADSDRAVVNVFWDVTDTVAGPPAPVLLGQYRGAERPLDPSIGNVPAARYDARNTGHAPDATGPEPPLARRWAFDLWGLPSGTPTVVDGTLFVGTGRPLLYALDATDGRELWRFAPERTTDDVALRVIATTVADGTAYVSTPAALHAVDAADGSERWRFGVDRAVSSGPAVATTPDGSVTEIFLVSEGVEERLHAVGPDGNERWQTPLGATEPSAAPGGTPAVTGEAVYVAARENTVAAFDRASGTERWRAEAAASRRTSAPVVRNGTVYTTWSDGMVAFDAADGTERWQRRGRDERLTAPVVTGEGVSVVSQDGTLTTLDPADGSERWTATVSGGGSIGGAPVAAGDALYGATTRGELYALDLTDGTRLWQEPLFAAASYAPVVTDGLLYAVAGKRQAATESSSSFVVYALADAS